ncbi:kelch domain-containing protein 10 homolog isoform X1 [Photinus pyralis]|uniref:Kelch domain-containing protein 10 homolog n=1 Tax=Photinus pyralis TaxID=7054 RepID=A0A1Y1LPV2_PHOPY|nr:kelch domain-containing protein 10 homolog isoform X1 [Photinus pyralis]
MFLTLFVKFFGYFYRILHILYVQMGNCKTNGVYVFKLYKYEKVKSNSRTPLPRSGHRIVCDTKNLYSFGGYNPLITQSEDEVRDDDDELNINSYPLFQELWKYNFATKKWKCYSGRRTLPQELASNAVVRTGNYLMVYACVYGGTGSPFGYRSSNQLYFCALNSDSGQMVEVNTTGQHPIPQYGQALVCHNNYLYTIGGTTGFTYSCDIHRLNIKERVWENVYICQGRADYEPDGRYRHEVAFDGKNIYILGGGTADNAFGFKKIPVFNIELKRWSKAIAKRDRRSVLSGYHHTGIPSPRRCHGAVQIETDNDIQVFINGGYDGDTVFDDLWRLELSTMQWTFIQKCVLPSPTYFHSAAVSPEGKMYVFGGIYGGDQIRRSSDIYSVWLCIPKLSEICWEALLHYNPQICNYSKERLINSGLPRGFLDRLV